MAKKSMGSRGKNATKPATSSLPNAELDVLSCVWQEEPVTARRIREMMKTYRPMAHGSVVTLLTRLEEKELVSKTKGPVGKAFLFHSTRKPEITRKRLVKGMVKRVFAGDVGVMVDTLLGVQPPTVGELGMIEKAVDAAKRKAKITRR